MAGANEGNKETGGDVLPEEIIGLVAETAGKLKEVTKEANKLWDTPNKWEEREAARAEREQKEYDSVQSHRKAIEKQGDQTHEQHVRSVDLQAARNTEDAAWNKESIENQRKSLALFERQVAALEGIATALSNANKR